MNPHPHPEIEALLQELSAGDEEKYYRLRKLQGEVDREMMKHDNPMGKAVAANKMMIAKYEELNALMQKYIKGGE